MKNRPAFCWIATFETDEEVRLMGQARMAVEAAGGQVLQLSDAKRQMIYCADRKLSAEIRAALKKAGT